MKKCSPRLPVFLLAWLASSAAFAGSFDATGEYDLDDETYAVAFSLEDSARIEIFDLEGMPSSLSSTLIQEPEVPLEGTSALRIGGPQETRASISLEQAAPALSGKRVYFTLWYQAHGSDLNASIQWVSGDRSSYLELGETAGSAIGDLRFLPTGRLTSDGWVELATHEVDFALGGTIPASFLHLVDGHYTQGGGPRDTLTPKHLEGSHVLIDAFEIHTVGDAIVPDASCTAPAEQLECGDHGTCLFGKCVDAVSVWGSPPLKSHRKNWIERYVTLFYSSLGSRDAQLKGDLITDRLEAPSSSSARDFWYAYYGALEDVSVGQSTPIRPTRPWKTTGGGGACLGPGVGDLLPDNDGEPTMMVFDLKENVDNTVTQTLQPGDVLTLVDGIPWKEWITHVPLLAFHFSGEDPNMLLKGYYLMNAAMTVGATLTFERCSRQNGQPCAEGEVTTVELDLEQLHAPQIWNDQALQGAELGYWCDWRFAPKATYPDSEGVAEDTFATALVDGIRHAVFNTFPASTYSRPERGWEPDYLTTIAEAPDKGFLLDMREGWGGDALIMERFFSRFMEEGNYGFGFYSWGGDEFDEASTQANIQLCFGSIYCGGHLHQPIIGLPHPLFEAEPRYPQKPVALLSGRNSDLSELLLWILAEKREGPTRIFGYAPSFGDFGVPCGLPHMLGELTPATHQCADAIFIDEDGARTEYLSGEGVAPHELIYQKQSDAIVGVDTVLARAEAWIEEQAALQGEQQ